MKSKVLWITNLLERITELSENAVLIKHLALESLLVVIMDPLSYIRRQFMEWHVLLHLLILKTFVQTTWWFNLHEDTSTGLMSDVTFSHILYHVFAEFFLSTIIMHLFYLFSRFLLKWITNSFVMGISKQWSRTKVQPFVYHLFCFILQKSPGKGHSEATKSIR